MLRVTNLDLNADTAAAITKRVLKDRNMQIVKRFTPVVSEYTVDVSPNNRYMFRLDDDVFTAQHQVKSENGWQTVGEIERTHSCVDNVDNDFQVTLSDLRSYGVEI
jgi:hypothetical protein